MTNRFDQKAQAIFDLCTDYWCHPIPPIPTETVVAMIAEALRAVREETLEEAATVTEKGASNALESSRIHNLGPNLRREAAFLAEQLSILADAIRALKDSPK